LDQQEKPDSASQVEAQSKTQRAIAEAPAPPDMTPMAWLKANAVFVFMLIFAVYYLYSNFGFEGVIKAGLVALGLGFVIFIHELGHFVAAKLCDVHVKTFSIGFGPALPGCSFKRGETQYMIGALPLGGYVSMVGEGSEADEGEEYPRSYKNKTVGQRMMIISAGVIMNVILGGICFIIVYRLHGVPRPPAVVWRVDSGSPAWQAGIKTGSSITQLGDVKNPTFDDLRLAVALSGHNTTIPFVFQNRNNGPKIEVALEPRRDKNDMVPMIGIAPPPRAVLAPLPQKDTNKVKPNLLWITPFTKNSPASMARLLPLEKDCIIMGISNPKGEGYISIDHDLKLGSFDAQEFARVLLEHEGKACKILYYSKASENPIEAEIGTESFMPGDAIVGTTKTGQKNYNPLATEKLSEVKAFEPRPEGNFFEFTSRINQLAGQPVVIEIKRSQEKEKTLMMFVPPAFHMDTGMNMKMGEVAAVRKGSPAEKAGVLVGDRIASIEITPEGKETKKFSLDSFNPIQLPNALAIKAGTSGNCNITLTVGRRNNTTHEALAMIPLPSVEWDHGFDGNLEEPVKPASPLSIPQLGIAFRVENTILSIKEKSPAQEAGAKIFDVIEQARFARIDRKTNKEVWDKWTELKSWRGNQQLFDQWAFAFAMLQERDLHKIQLKVRRAGEPNLVELAPIVATQDTSWPSAELGLRLISDFVMQKADSIVEAVEFGTNDTIKSIRSMYQNLASLMSGRISTDSLGGPIEIASQTFSAAEDPFALILFLGMISSKLSTNPHARWGAYGIFDLRKVARKTCIGRRDGRCNLSWSCHRAFTYGICILPRY
jgi:regulator of sigma E protease